MDAHGLELRGNGVHRVPGRDAVEIDFDGGVLAQPVTVDAQMLVTDTSARIGQRLGSGDFFFTGLWAETPEIQKRLHG
ncbi:hypothetical protein D3C72_1680220 [compost metagenome]